LAWRRGVHLCPNFLLTENALKISEENLYTAHEVVQMIPLYGFGTYRKFRKLNAWTTSYLPNANGIDHLGSEQPLSRMGLLQKRALERALGGAIGDRIEE
jgi:hypothetical protein